jgi:predicted nucleic acid-binding protein
MRLYADSVSVIYLVERVQPFFPVVDAKFAAGVTMVVSDLTRMECRVKPIELGQTALLALYDTVFSQAEIVALDTPVFDLATEVRAAFRFKTADAIHLAAATHHRCDGFVTNDRRLAAANRIPVQLI